MMVLWNIWYQLLCVVCCTEGAKILGIFPTPAYSHQQFFQIIMKALNARGHEITVISTDPLKESITNYTDIDISYANGLFKDAQKFEDFKCIREILKFAASQIVINSELVDRQLSSPQLQEFLRSNNTKYDLVFMEEFMYQSYYGLIHHVGSPPVIGIMPFQFLWLAGEEFGIPNNPSYVLDPGFELKDKMTFYERMTNFYYYLWIRYKIHIDLIPLQEKIMRKHFGAVPPSIEDARKNKSLLMMGTNWLAGYPIPLPPAVVTIEGTILKTNFEPLPKEIQQFLDGARNGVIYMSFGSNIRTSYIQKEKIQIFLEVFSKLPQKVLVKWDHDLGLAPAQALKIMVYKWIPQQEVLAHKNVKLFITHCGLQSLQESIHYAVPMLAIPFYGDQNYNANKVETAKIGLQLSFTEVTRKLLLKSINTILKDDRNNVQVLSTISREKPQSPVEKAIWWTEYVIRHKGAKHLRSASMDLHWYQYLLLDIIVLVILSISVILFFLFSFFRIIYFYFSARLKVKCKND